MKKSLIICCLCACAFAAADTIDPSVRLSFDLAASTSGNHNDNMAANSVANSSYTVGITLKNGNYIQYGATGDYLGSTGYTYQAGNKNHFTITGTDFNLSNSFTLSFAAKMVSATAVNWSNVFAITANNKNIHIQKNTTTGGLYMAGNGVASTGNIIGAELNNTSYTHLTLVYTAPVIGVEGSTGAFTMYQNGVLLDSWTSTFGNGGAISLELGGYGSYEATSLYIDEVGIYDAALTAAQIQNNLVGKAVGSIPTTNIPEPTTATLSLLALAGLAARRRRK